MEVAGRLVWQMLYSKRYPDYTIVTLLEWKQILKNDIHKNIIIESIRFLVNQGRQRFMVLLYWTIIFICYGKS